MSICECGCGQEAGAYLSSNSAQGIVEGEPRKFIHGHNSKLHLKTHCIHGHLRTPENVGVEGHCLECQRIRSQYYKNKNSEKVHRSQRSRHLRVMRGMTSERYEEMLKEQNECCAVCRKPFDKTPHYPHIDHDHNCCPGYKSCGKCNRGLLCINCNRLLGAAFDSIEILKRAIEYLSRQIKDSDATRFCD